MTRTRSLPQRDELARELRSLTPVRFADLPRRWPWAVWGALAGAAAGVGAVLVARRVLGQDAPDAQDPSELEAVVDTARPAA